jgi:RNA polymerase sigma-70 factor (ECF subfamily)
MEMKDYQKKLFPYAYNILDSYDDAKDAVQDVVAKHFLNNSNTTIENESNYLIRGVINQSINLKKRKSRTLNPKLTLPEPISTENADTDITRKDILSFSLLVLLDKLNPKERAIFILKEAFDYSHDDIARTLDLSIENSRKLLSRAKAKLGEYKPSRPGSASTTRQLEDYISAIQTGNMKSLENMFAKEISVKTDGGTVSIVAEFVSGIIPVAQFLTYVYTMYQTKATIRITSVNNQPALLFYKDGILINCQVFSINSESGAIQDIHSIVNPEKLKNLKIFK